MKNKKRFWLAIIIFVITVAIAIGIAYLLEYQPMPLPLYILLVVIMLALIFFATHYLGHVERTTGVYVCSCCGHVFVPSSKNFWSSVHAFGKRRMVCPLCNKANWCSKDYGKEIE